MRLGVYPCDLVPDTLAAGLYGMARVEERHRHRYEFNNGYRKRLEAAGMIVSGVYSAKNLVEIIELPDHPWFVGVQFHPEFRSRPVKPHPLFVGFVGAAANRSREDTGVRNQEGEARG